MPWTYGYVSEIEYNHNYFPELSPSSLRLALLNRGHDPFPPRPLRYLELGFGQGLSLALHAAATDGEYWGTDFNPAQAANAQQLADSFPGSLHILNDSFEELAARKDLPTFDVIVLHGIWSWISTQNRNVIVDIVRKSLNVGGVLYISYNCTPGWSAAMPLRHLMMLHERYAAQRGDSMEKRVEEALAFSKKVAESGSVYFRENKQAVDWLRELLPMNRRYLAHEYFNRDWDPMPFTDVATLFEDAKLTFVASGSLLDQLDAINLAPEAKQMLAGISNTILRESVRDFFTNTRFRKDLYVKGPRQLAKTSVMARFRNMRFVLLAAPEKIPLVIRGPLGEGNLLPEIYRPVIDALASNGYEGRTLEELESDPRVSSYGYQKLQESLIVLCALGHVHPAQHPDLIEKALPKTQALNRHIVDRALFDSEIGVLVSPVTGAGLGVNRFEQLFIRSYQEGIDEPERWAEAALRVLDKEGQLIVKDGKPLQTEAENRAELRQRAQAFASDYLPVLKALRVV